MRRLIVGFGLVAPLGFVALLPRAPWSGLALLALSHALLLYPTLRPNVQWLGPVITHFATGGREVWLTIDDGPTADTPALVEMLAHRGVRATFFIKGSEALARPELVRTIVEDGHSVANHSLTHPSGSFWCLLPGQIAREMDGCSDAIEAITGGRPQWFRAPVGMKNPAVHPALQRRSMRLIGWTVRGFDSVKSDADDVLRRILPKLEPGAILVTHQGREWSVRVIERLVEAVQERGYTFVIPSDDRLKTKR
jgi:peptidoglycan/xylan/chitin deacetylase (PgdA/CDA1 family)